MKQGKSSAIWAVLIVLALFQALPFAQQAIAQESEATPTALDPVATREGRLGGTLSEVQDAWGSPDWVDVGLIGYNNRSLGGVDTITMVYFDAQERVRAFLLVYLEQPDQFDDQNAIAAVVADVAPRDGNCESEPLEQSQLGDEVYPCQSVALEGVLTSAEMLEFEVVGKDGSYSYSVNPTDDAYFEIAVKFGTDKPEAPPAPQPPPTPTPRPPVGERYPPVASMDALVDGQFAIDQPLSFGATILEIEPENGGVSMLVEGYGEDGSSAIVRVISDEDMVGYYPDNYFVVYGVFTGEACATDGACIPIVHIIEL